MKALPVFCIAAFFAMSTLVRIARADAPPASAPALTVAIVDFDAKVPGNDQIGKQITDAMTAVLTGENGFTLVDRSSMNRILQEHSLNLTGLVDQDKATQIGKLVGAKLLIEGRAFVIDKNMYVTAKVMGTETGLVEAVLVKASKDADIGSLVMDLSQKVTEKIHNRGASLIAAPNNGPDPQVALIDQLKGKSLPKLGIVLVERHINNAQPQHVDPAVDTELKSMLTQAGFTIIDGDEKDWAREGVAVVLKGEAFSETAAARFGDIISCSGRVELTMVNQKDGKVLLTKSATARAADLSEQMAAKTALQKAAHQLGLNVMEYYAKAAGTTQP